MLSCKYIFRYFHKKVPTFSNLHTISLRFHQVMGFAEICSELLVLVAFFHFTTAIQQQQQPRHQVFFLYLLLFCLLLFSFRFYSAKQNSTSVSLENKLSSKTNFDLSILVKFIDLFDFDCQSNFICVVIVVGNCLRCCCCCCLYWRIFARFYVN